MLQLLRDVHGEVFAEAAKNDGTDLVFPVKICGLISKNGRKYPEAVLCEAVKAGLYEGVPLCLDSTDHKTHTTQAGVHLYERRVGLIENTVYRPGQGVFGNAVLNPKHVYAESLAWDMRRQTRNLGLSQVIEGNCDPQGNITTIAKVRSVDVTLYPATTQTFAESAEDLVEDAELAAERAAREAAKLDELVANLLSHARFQEYMTTFAANLQPVKPEAVKDEMVQLIREVISTQTTQPTPVAHRPGVPELPAAVPAWQPPTNSPIKFVRR